MASRPSPSSDVRTSASRRLFNRLSGEERSVVHDLPGTTRDAIDTLIETDEGTVKLIDTAGMRRRARSGEGPEYYSLVRALRALDRADVALLVLDATEGVTHQDQRLAERIDASGSPVVILLNKWDLLDTEGRLEVAEAVADRLAFLGLRAGASGLGQVRPRRAPTPARGARGHGGLSPPHPDRAAERRPAQRAQAAHPAPGGARILYGVQGAIDPPTITLFATRRLPPTYLRYMERSLAGALRARPDPDRAACPGPSAAMTASAGRRVARA